MTYQSRGIGEAGTDIIGFKIGEILQDFGRARTGCRHFQYVRHANAHAANAGPAMALFGPNRDAEQEISYDGNVCRLAFDRQYAWPKGKQDSRVGIVPASRAIQAAASPCMS